MTDNHYFGKPWNLNIARHGEAPAPLGEPCLYCGEAIQDGDQGMLIARGGIFIGDPEVLPVDPVHRECMLRMLMGSVAHQQKRCSCFGGQGEDDPNLSKREAARAAVAYWQKMMPCPECGGINGEHEDDCEEMIDTAIVEESGGG